MFCHQWRWRSAICASFSCRFLFAILSLENKMLEANSCPLWRSLSLRCLLSCRQLTWHSLSWRNSGRLDYLTTPSLSVRRWSWRTLLGRVVVGLVGCTPQRLLCWQTVCSHAIVHHVKASSSSPSDPTAKCSTSNSLLNVIWTDTGGNNTSDCPSPLRKWRPQCLT